MRMYVYVYVCFYVWSHGFERQWDRAFKSFDGGNEMEPDKNLFTYYRQHKKMKGLPLKSWYPNFIALSNCLPDKLELANSYRRESLCISKPQNSFTLQCEEKTIKTAVQRNVLGGVGPDGHIAIDRGIIHWTISIRMSLGQNVHWRKCVI